MARVPGGGGGDGGGGDDGDGDGGGGVDYFKIKQPIFKGKVSSLASGSSTLAMKTYAGGSSSSLKGKSTVQGAFAEGVLSVTPSIPVEDVIRMFADTCTPRGNLPFGVAPVGTAFIERIERVYGVTFEGTTAPCIESVAAMLSSAAAPGDAANRLRRFLWDGGQKVAALQFVGLSLPPNIYPGEGGGDAIYGLDPSNGTGEKKRPDHQAAKLQLLKTVSAVILLCVPPSRICPPQHWRLLLTIRLPPSLHFAARARATARLRCSPQPRPSSMGARF
jgi:hypothetical protein